MINKKRISLLLIYFLLVSCSFDNKTGIWGDSKKEKERISKLAKEQKEIIETTKVFSSENLLLKEILLKEKIILSKAKKNLSWEMSGLNNQNFLGNIYLTGINSTFLKKKIGKNKFSIFKIMNSPLISKDNIIFTDDTGTIFSINQYGKINWRKNIYKKVYKKVYKNLSFSIYENNIYISDNIGFIYALSLQTGKLIWIKNHGIPLKSNIKIFNNKIFLINQDNRFFSLNIKDGTKIWDIRSISSFIKSQNLLPIAITNKGNAVVINSAGDLFKVNGNSGEIQWSSNTTGSLFAYASDFFKSSEIVISEGDIIFSAGSSLFSYDLQKGYINWEKNISFVGTPIIDGKNIFFVTSNGFFVIMSKKNGKIISSNYILKILKKRKRNTSITGFIMGSGKIYSITLNGYLIVSSATSGTVEYSKKIGQSVTSTPIINDGKLYILTKKSRILGFN